MFSEMLEELLPEGWEFVDESVLICPHGYRIEYDGQCPDGCVSPLISMGLI